MNKNQLPRRGFLKSFVKVVSAAGLASLLKLVPEAQEVLAQGAGDQSKLTVEELSGAALEKAIQAVNDFSDGKTMWQYLVEKGYVPDKTKTSGVKVYANEQSGTLVRVPFAHRGSLQQAVLTFGFGNGQAKVGAGFYAGEPIDIDAYAVKNGRVAKEAHIQKMSNGSLRVEFTTGKTVVIDPPLKSLAFSPGSRLLQPMSHDPGGCSMCSWICGILLNVGCSPYRHYLRSLWPRSAVSSHLRCSRCTVLHAGRKRKL